MAEEVPLPAVYNFAQEPISFLEKLKKKASTKFAFTRAEALKNSSDLAYWLYVYRKDVEAIEVCRFLGQYQFTGNYNLWSHVEKALTLQSRLAKEMNLAAESKTALERVVTAGVHPSRITGSMLAGSNGYRERIKDAIKESSKTSERAWRLIAIRELCVITELGGSDEFPAADAEQELQDELAILRKLQGIK
jgi:hypothetical protein